jgi:hypothetical protein
VFVAQDRRLSGKPLSRSVFDPFFAKDPKWKPTGFWGLRHCC